MKTQILSANQYIEQFSEEIQILLRQVQTAIQSKAPEAIESISYGMVAYKFRNKPLVYFAGYKNHIGFYATPNGHTEFKKELSIYKQGKGSVQFPLDKPLPLALIKRIVAFRLKSIKEKTT